MSASPGAALRSHPPREVHLLGWLAAIPVLVILLWVGVASADPPPSALRLSAAEVEQAGTAIRLLPHVVSGSTLLEVQPRAASLPGGRGASLLAVSSDASQAALADQLGELSGLLTIARADGSQLRVQLPGLLAAGFALDGKWLAVVDGRGALWQVDATTGSATQLADGPFLGSPVVDADGSLMLLSVPSVEAPYSSRLVRVGSSTGTVTPLSDEGLVYGAFPLTDGGVAVVAHEPGRTVVREIGHGGPRLLADLGAQAGRVAVATDGRHIAFEVADRGIAMIDGPGSGARRVGAGSQPCFAADGSLLLVRRGAGTVALALDGSVMAAMDRPTSLVGSVGCLP